MEQIVCSVCGSTIDFLDGEKVSVLYSQCSGCKNGENKKKE